MRVNHVERVIDRPDCQVFDVDCATKYARVLGYSGDGSGTLVVMLDTTRDSLHVAEGQTLPTELRFTLPDTESGDCWRVLGELSRYSGVVVLYRPTHVRDEETSVTETREPYDEWIPGERLAAYDTPRARARRERDAFSAYLDTLADADRWAHCGAPRHHLPHKHTVCFSGETPNPGVPCVGTPDLAQPTPLPPAARQSTPPPHYPVPHIEQSERPGDLDEEQLRALRPGSQPLPTPSDREGAHDALLREHLAGAVAGRRSLGLSRYHTLLQAGNGRDSLRDALEEVLDLAAYLQVWTQARDEALVQLRQVRENLAGEKTCFAEAQVELIDDAVDLLVGGGGESA